MHDTAYPIGHPKREVHNKEVDWRASGDNPYLGVIKAFVIPPQHLRVPVLPMRMKNGRLTFPLCSLCTRKHPKGLHDPAYSCTHNEEQRGWVATITHMELNAALDRGYRVIRLIRTLHWDEWSTELFKPFVQ